MQTKSPQMSCSNVISLDDSDFDSIKHPAKSHKEFFKVEYSGETNDAVHNLDFGDKKLLMKARFLPISNLDQRRVYINIVKLNFDERNDIVISKFSVDVTKDKLSCLKQGETTEAYLTSWFSEWR